MWWWRGAVSAAPPAACCVELTAFRPASDSCPGLDAESPTRPQAEGGSRAEGVLGGTTNTYTVMQNKAMSAGVRVVCVCVGGGSICSTHYF